MKRADAMMAELLEIEGMGDGEMSKPPLVASKPWTPAEDEKLQTLAALGERPTAIAEQLQRSEAAVRHRCRRLGIIFKRIMIASTERTFATHPERQFMQYLRGQGWVKVSALPPGQLERDLLSNYRRRLSRVESKRADTGKPGKTAEYRCSRRAEAEGEEMSDGDASLRG